ncbi:hypothetical protein ABI59_19110 [Acidobacteria bacterium Mor1]|nr:hypothetical protein ABI59_19110 [Acidobacteria bacterium Mor1]
MSRILIGEVARRAGIATSAIRYYEAEGLLRPPERRNNRRVYSESVLDELALIDLAKNAGFTVVEIRGLLKGLSRRASPSARWKAMAQDKMQELDERIEEARRMQAVLAVVMSCRCPTLDDCRQAIRSGRGDADAKENR